MPVSRKRDKKVYTPPPTRSDKPVRLDSPRWLPIVMVAMWVIGLTWIVVWYMISIPFLESLGAWNVAIGFGFIGVGFALSTRWR